MTHATATSCRTRPRKTSLIRGLTVMLTALACVLPCLSPGPVDAAAAVTDQTIVHVGFFQLDGYHDMDTGGDKSGYGYDFLQMIAGYANFKYVYVGYQKRWEDMADMLADGEIDMMTYAMKTAANQDRFAFSQHSIGTSYAMLTTSVNNAAFAATDYQPFDGMRIGIVRGSSRQASLAAYAAAKGLRYTLTSYSSLASLQAALAAGRDIDAMVSESLRELAGADVIDRFDPQELYVMVRRGDTALLATIDEAIRRLNAADPSWSVELMSRYFLSGSTSQVALTLSESKYLASQAAAGRRFKVLFNPSRYPLSYYDDAGTPRGVLVDIFTSLAAAYSIPYEFVKTANIDDYYTQRAAGAADIVLDFAESTDNAEVLGYRLTTSYATSAYAVVTASTFSGTIRTVSVVDGSSLFHDLAKNYAPRAKFIYRDSFDQCLQDVKDGTADATYTYSLTAQMFIVEDNANKIKATQLNDAAAQFRLAIAAQDDMTLYGLMNRLAHSVGDAQVDELYNYYLLEAKRSYTLWDFLVSSPLAMVGIILLVVAVALVFILLQKRSADRLKTSNQALSESQVALEKALQAANAANAAKTRFLSQMSHDIRTPLNGIIGMTEIAQTHPDDHDQVVNALDKISYSSDHLLTLINDILDLSRIESGKMVIAHEPTDIRQTVDQCVEVLRSSVISRDIAIQTAIGPFDRPLVLTDALHIRQILINVISNAVKFTPNGGHITFRAAGRADAAGHVLNCQFEVIDDGIGMSEEFQQHIFEAFTQADSFDARSQYKGSGLGMSIVKQFVDLLNGTIAIDSHLHRGTAVTVTLPLDIDPDAALPSPTADIAADYDFSGVRVLLAEDNDINVEVARLMLQSRGMTVDTAADGRIALSRFASAPAGTYQCILMDIMMPNMDGYAAAKAIRALDRPDAAAIPIIAMTANAFSDDVAAASDCGMNAHIAKPIESRVVMATMARCLGPRDTAADEISQKKA